MRRNKAVLRAHPRERLIFIEFHSARSRTFVPHADNRKPKRKKLGETPFRRGAHATNRNAEIFLCDMINPQRKRLARGMCF